MEPKEEDTTVVKAEVHAENSEETLTTPVLTKQEMEEVPTVIVDTDAMEVEHPEIHGDPLHMENHIQQHEAIVQESLPQENHIIHHELVPPEEVVSVAAATAGLDETSNLHQEAAVAMAALHEGARGLAHHQLPQETYVERDGSHTMWFPKQQY